jgi:hypothetical protein
MEHKDLIFNKLASANSSYPGVSGITKIKCLFFNKPVYLWPRSGKGSRMQKNKLNFINLRVFAS